ncbi:MAG: ribbon-helix-helix protein, CopG family [Microcystis sp. M54BS1]|nr:ribbon-helix-helix protein, CopG family [Microcystis sp. M54BS1]
MTSDTAKTVRTSVILSEEKHELIAKLASKNGVSTAWIIRYALNEFLEKYGNEKELKIKPVKE